MKSVITRFLSTFAACAMLAALAFPGPARGQRTAERTQRPVESESQEDILRLPAPVEPTQELQLPEVSPRELAGRTPTIQLPAGCPTNNVDVQVHGDADNFNPPGPAVTLSPQLTAFLVGKKVKGYDDRRLNMVFADSFRLRNCRVCYAVLQVSVRHYNADAFTNDSITAGVAGFGPANNPPGGVVFASLGNIWVPPNPNPRLRSFVLPANALNQHIMSPPAPPKFVDLVGQDDTDFDYARLIVWYY